MKRPNWSKHVLRIQPLLPEEKSRLIRDFLAKYSKKLGSQEVYQLIEHPATSSPIYLRLILEQLRVYGNFDDLAKELAGYLRYATPDELCDRILEHWESDYNSAEDPNLVKVLTSSLPPSPPSTQFMEYQKTKVLLK